MRACSERREPEHQRPQDDRHWGDRYEGQERHAEEAARHPFRRTAVAGVDVADEGGHEQRREKRASQEPVVDQVR